MKRLLHLLLLVAISPAMAQNSLTFDESDFNFGEIQEVDGPVEHVFNFTNNGLEAIQIVGVRASCGCTTPAWTKESVPPGGQGSITARYNPRNRPGAFRKSLTVSTSNPSIKPRLYINGNVIPKPKTVEDDLPTQIDGIRVKYLSFNFGKMTTEKEVLKSFDVYNTTDSVLTYLADKTEAPKFLSIVFEPAELAPKSRGKIHITYSPQKSELGFQSTGVKLYTSESERPKSFNVLATISEFFPELSPEELEKAPKLAFDKRSYNFGKLEKDAKVSTEFVLTNQGKKKLNLRKISTNCSCTVAEIDKMNLKPGESTKLSVTFDSERRKGRQYKSITVFSNDPTAPTQVITIKAEVPRT